MIPKKIHYCWFGGNPLPELAQKCIASWKEFCPDYAIIEWNESNYDVSKNKYMYDAYQCKKFSFVSDYARLDIIYTHGGIYLDTDVEIIKPFDDLLELDGFCGIEKGSEYIALGLGFGASKGNQTIKLLLDEYENLEFLVNGKMDLTPIPKITTKTLIDNGYKFQEENHSFGEMSIFKSEFFSPRGIVSEEINITENTYSVHHYDASWYSESQRYALNLRRKLSRVFPKKIAGRLSWFIAQCKFDGFFVAIKNTLERVRGKK